MKLFKTLFLTLLVGLFFSCSGQEDQGINEEESNQESIAIPIANVDSLSINQPSIELVFCLDATSSMSGLIHTAKEKIWNIVANLSQTNSSSSIKLGMVFYRDRGDHFVTKTYPLTIDIDSIYNELLAIEAHGGGDAPEGVNAALREAIAMMNWSTNARTYQTVFLVGDCPPHMDYGNEVKYPETCQLANKKGIVINTIKLGLQCEDAIAHFKAIATKTNGEYQQLGQNATDIVIQTPYDDSINDFSKKIDESKVYYGSTDNQEKMKVRKEKSLSFYDKASVSSNSARNSFNGSSSGKDNWFGNKELIQDVIDGKVALKDLKEGELPKELVGLSEEDRLVYVEGKRIEREKRLSELKKMLSKKEQYIQNEFKNTEGKESFTNEVFRTMKKQAKEKGVIIDH